jgi:hypothetical protein
LCATLDAVNNEVYLIDGTLVAAALTNENSVDQALTSPEL